MMVSNASVPHPPLRKNDFIKQNDRFITRYLKSVFPKAEETYLLDLLSCSDNNVNDVTQQLLSLGHLKKDYPQPLTPRRNLTTPPVKNTVAPPTIVTEPIPRKIPSQTEIEKGNSLNLVNPSITKP